MSHGYTILEMTNAYEAKAKGFKKMVDDIMTNNVEYHGVLNIDTDFDLLFTLYSSDRNNAVAARIYRGFPNQGIVSNTEKVIDMYLFQALNMFPEIKKIKFIKDKWLAPYNK